MLIVKDKRALIIKLNNPERVLASVKGAQQFTYKNQSLVAVPHTVGASATLNAIGVNAPSPILHHYEWSGRYTPYEHQKQTAAFMTLNRKGIVLNQIGCVDADTEYLTPYGWKRISEYDGGMVAQYWPETGKIDFVDNPEYVKKPCVGMIRIKTGMFIDQLLSPEHRVLYRPGYRDGYKVTTAQDLYDSFQNGTWRGDIITTFKSDGAEGIPLTDDELRLQVFVVVVGRINANNLTKCTIKLRTRKSKHRLRALLSATGTQWSETGGSDAASEGLVTFKFSPPLNDTSFGDWGWRASSHQMEVLLDEVMYWSHNSAFPGEQRLATTSKATADFVQYLTASAGHTSVVTERKTDGRATDRYEVRIQNAVPQVTLHKWNNNVHEGVVRKEQSTDGYKYCFMVPSTFLLLRRNGCIFATGNTGKSLSALWAADYLMDIGEVKRTLILSPLSTLERVWGEAVFLDFPHRNYAILHGSAKRRLKLLDSDAEFFIINHDGFGIIADKAHEMFDFVIVDEAAVYRNARTTRYKAFFSWMKKQPSDTRLMLMTGTPTPNEPTDAWALARLIGNTSSAPTFTGFREKVMKKISMYTWVPRTEAPEIVSQILQPSILYKRDDCFDLPDTVTQTRKVDLTAEQAEHYKDMVRSLIAEVNSNTITAVNEAVKMMKLIQIACGVAYDDNGDSIELDCRPRVNVTKEIIEQADGKVIVFVPLTGTLHMLERELSKHWTVGVVNGSVSATKRNEIFEGFQNRKDPHVLLAHPATMAHGLTLTAASTVVWYGPITSNEQYVQANGRVERIGKRHVSNVVHIESTEIEHKLYARLKNKQRVQGLLLDIIEREGKLL